MGDEELAAVSIGAGIGHRKNSAFVMLKLRVELVLETITRAAGAVTERITSLDHESRDHAVKDRSVIERPLYFLAGFGICPLFGTARETDKISHRFGRLVLEELNHEVAHAGLEGCVNRGFFVRRLPCYGD